jgi:hypothetical protein
LNGILVSRLGECQLKMTNVQGDQIPAKRQKLFKTIRELIHEDRRQTIHVLADAIRISYGVCQEILTENLNVHCIAAKFVARLLTNKQKQQRINVS